jgi:hypothetical protein
MKRALSWLAVWAVYCALVWLWLDWLTKHAK